MDSIGRTEEPWSNCRPSCANGSPAVHPALDLPLSHQLPRRLLTRCAVDQSTDGRWYLPSTRAHRGDAHVAEGSPEDRLRCGGAVRLQRGSSSDRRAGHRGARADLQDLIRTSLAISASPCMKDRSIHAICHYANPFAAWCVQLAQVELIALEPYPNRGLTICDFQPWPQLRHQLDLLRLRRSCSQHT